MFAGAVAAWSPFLLWASFYGGFAITASTGVELGFGLPTLIAGIGLIVVGLILAADGPVRRLDWIAVLFSLAIVIVFVVTLILVPQPSVPTMQPGGGGFYAFKGGFVLLGLSGAVALICSLALAWASPFTRRWVQRLRRESRFRL